MCASGRGSVNTMRVFVGLVTHPNSHYAGSRSLRGLKGHLLDLGRAGGTKVSDTNPFKEQDVPPLAVAFRPLFIAITLFRVRRHRQVGLLPSVLAGLKELSSEILLLIKGNPHK